LNASELVVKHYLDFGSATFLEKSLRKVAEDEKIPFGMAMLPQIE